MDKGKEKVDDPINVYWKPCILCGNSEYLVYQMYPRAPDEGVMHFYICCTCAKTYRMVD